MEEGRRMHVCIETDILHGATQVQAPQNKSRPGVAVHPVPGVSTVGNGGSSWILLSITVSVFSSFPGPQWHSKQVSAACFFFFFNYLGGPLFSFSQIIEIWQGLERRLFQKRFFYSSKLKGVPWNGWAFHKICCHGTCLRTVGAWDRNEVGGDLEEY